MLVRYSLAARALYCASVDPSMSAPTTAVMVPRCVPPTLMPSVVNVPVSRVTMTLLPLRAMHLAVAAELMPVTVSPTAIVPVNVQVQVNAWTR